jgi:hypothetical protein
MQSVDINDHNTGNKLMNERESYERAVTTLVRPRTDPPNRYEEAEGVFS